jgi:hypothetical protein
MATKEFLPSPESIAKYVKQNAKKNASSMKAMMRGKGGQDTTREDDYKGHHIVIRTRYDITVDGQAVTGHMMLTNSGQVQYHGLPNYSFDSAVGLVRALIDNFPEDFVKKPGRRSSSRGGNGSPMGGMKMSNGKASKKIKSKTRGSKSKK